MTSSQQSRPFSYTTYTQATLALLAGWTVFRLWFCTQPELVGDEAYYWLWTQHPDWSYFSKGPGVAWAITLGTTLFGNNELGVRFVSVMLGAGTGWMLFLWGRSVFDERTGFWAVVCASFSPLFLIGSFLMTIDPLSVFFWGAAGWFCWKGLGKASVANGALIGLMIGLGALAKYTNLIQIACILAFALWEPTERKRLLSAKYAMLLLVSLACLLPIVIWNANHEWITVTHLQHRGDLDKPFSINLYELAEFLLSQAVVLNPLLLLILLAGILFARPLGWNDTGRRFLLSQVLPLFILYSLLSLNKAGQANWTAPAFLGVIVLVARYGILLHERCGAVGKWSVRAALGVCVFLIVCVHALPLIPPEAFPRDPMRRLRGWKATAEKVEAIQKEQNASFIISQNRELTSLLSFYHPQQQRCYIPSHNGILNQFSFWPGYEGRTGQNALYIDKSDSIPPALEQEFESLQPLGKVSVGSHEFFLVLCRNLRSSDSFTPPK